MILLLTVAGFFVFAQNTSADARFLSYRVDVARQTIKLYWKDDKNEHFGSIQNLKSWLQKRNETLLFAMNGGMYKEDRSPLGLYIENGKTLTKLNTYHGEGNFYLKPNGVFYISNDGKAVISPTQKMAGRKNIRYATQSGPMLVTDGRINPVFTKGSANLNIRNGVGILPDGKAVFVMSKTAVNLYDFADYFAKLGCKNALFLDGFVSRTYLPEQNWSQLDGDFGVIIGVTSKTVSPAKKP